MTKKTMIMAAVIYFSAALLALAGEIREGAAMYVKPNSMWFQSDTALAAWQRDQARLSPKALKLHQDDLLGSREAWQFIYKQRVRIRGYGPTENQVEVEALGPGRFQGFIWWVDAKDLTR